MKLHDLPVYLFLVLLAAVFWSFFVEHSAPVQAQIGSVSTTPCYLNNGVGSTAAVITHNCRNVASTIQGFRVVNMSASPAFLRLYNLRTSPNCASATGFQESVPIPANSMQGGGIVEPVMSFRYSQGVGFCLTGGGAANDNTAPPAGVYGVIAVGN
jgi:hypothetical protein